MYRTFLKFVQGQTLFIFFLALLTSSESFAQSDIFKNVTISSPNAAGLGKYGDIPVNYHTGIPQINIPVYTIQDGPLQLPISLSYHAGGLKVMEQASWVGAGWSLNAGGIITRSVMGAPDDRGFANSNTLKGHFSDYGYNNYLFVSSVQGNGPPLTSDNKAADDVAIQNATKDGEPDLFFFNFNGYTGKFYFRDDRTPVLVPEADFKIEPILVSGSVYIKGFVITTTDGTKYYFGKNTLSDGNIDAYEVTNPYTVDNGLTSGSAISSWYLNKIESADSQFTIRLIYQQEQYSYYTINTFPIEGNTIAAGASTRGFGLVKNYINGVRLSQVAFSNGVVNFVPGAVRTDLGDYIHTTISDSVNTDAKSLGAIQITNNRGFCKYFKLFYNYFLDDSTSLVSDINSYSISSDKKRLRLDSMQEQTCDSSQKFPPYRFSYNGPSGDPDFAPRQLSFGQDHWGYYNRKYNNTGLIPAYSINDFTFIAGADRESSWPEMSYGSLKKITYPTGGSTRFVFEPNDVWLNFNYYTETSRSTASIGPGVGQSGTQTVTLTTNTNPYKLSLDFHTNTSAGSTSGSASFGGLSVNSTTPHAEVIVQPGSGSQTWYLQQNNMSGTTNDYATATVYEEVPANFQANKIVGGLRIDSVIISDGLTSTDQVTHYTYRDSSRSTGMLYSRPVYVQELRNDIVELTNGYAATSQNSCTSYGCLSCGPSHMYLKSPGSIRPMATTQGNALGYNEVHVSQAGNGYSVYRYYGSDVWDNILNDVSVRNVHTLSCNDSAASYPNVPLPFEFKRGELKYEGIFKENGELVKDATYYVVYVNDSVKTPGYVVNTWGPAQYDLVSARKTQSTVVSRVYGASGTVLTMIDSSFFTSPYHHQMTRHVEINSLGKKLETRYKYSFDFSLPSCDTISNCYSTYAGSAASAFSTFSTQKFTCTSGTWNCVWVAYQQYRRDVSIARASYVSCRRTNFTDSSNVYRTNHNNAKASADATLKPILELQDEYINVPIEVSNWKDGQLASAAFTKYGYPSSPSTPTNKVYPDTLKRINLADLSSTFTASTNTNTTLTKDSRYEDEENIAYDKGMIAEQVKHDNVKIAYLWDYQSNYPIAKCLNAGLASIAYTSFETSNTGNWSGITGSYVDSASKGITGKKYYNQSSFSISKSGLSGSAYYVVSYWSKNGYYTIDGTQSGYPKTLNTVALASGTWTLYEHLVTGQSTITITGSGALDELRLFPKNAQMVTYTYDPLVGMTAQCDINNRISYYEYDRFGRLTLVRDTHYNILKKLCYNYAGQVEDCGLAPVCTSCSGDDKKCINGTCETGTKLYLSSTHQRDGTWRCSYVYYWSDCSVSDKFFETNGSSCSVGAECDAE